MFRLPLILAIALAAAPAATAPAKLDPKLGRCDMLAADPWDPLRLAPGVPADRLDSGRAVEACRGAVAAAPDEPRLHHQLGRALKAAGRGADALGSFGRAAGKGYAPAQHALAAAALEGRDDAALAAALDGLIAAAEHGYAPACELLAALHEAGGPVDRDLGAAYAWAERAAEQGSATAQARMARYYAEGIGVQRDLAQAARWNRLAAGQGLAEAQYALADQLRRGRGVNANPAVAAHWLGKAAQRGHLPSQLALGLFHLAGEGGRSDADRAVDWLRRAAEGGSAPAQQVLVALDRAGLDTDVDRLDLDHWELTLGEAEDPDALFALGRWFDGRDATDQARSYLERAVALGHPAADEELASLAE
ncbi:MAG TPA: tetratricopeptide repeat protein [Alphaproteobacteria bacterium]|nr:tetratricopeptide repeat protein [Alphaproteobacteria bacterium]